MLILSSFSVDRRRKSGLSSFAFFVLLCFSFFVCNVRSENEKAIIAPENDKDGKELLKILDNNHNGLLDQSEYDLGIKQLDSFLMESQHNREDKGGSSVNSMTQNGFWKAFVSSLTMILATEIGDKTFFIAAVLSMKHARSAVFLGAIIALIVMTIISTFMGLVLPQMIPRKYTHILGGILFLYFGIKLLAESRSMQANQVSEELAEVEEELLQQKSKKSKSDGATDIERSPASNGSTLTIDSSATENADEGSNRKRKKKKFWYTITLQALTLTFIAEWGDRSQIATIALAAAKNPYGVTMGGCVGHSICTGLAVVGGRMLAKSISEKSVTYYGGIIFLLFGIHSLFFEI